MTDLVEKLRNSHKATQDMESTFHNELVNEAADTIDSLVEALQQAKKELLLNKDDAYCDHDANVCYCEYWRVIDRIDAALRKAGVE